MKHRSQSFAYAFVALTLVVHLLIPVKIVFAQEEDDSPQSVDITADCKGLEEDSPAPDPGNVWPPDFDIFFPPVVPASVAGVGGTLPLGEIDWKIKTFSEFMNSMAFVGDEGGQASSIELRADRFGSDEEGTINLFAEAVSFQSDLDLLQYAWWKVENEDGNEVLVSLNGIAAGGEAFKTTDRPVANGTRCGIMTRNPQTDNDNDGMDDFWERRYSGSLGGLSAQDDSDEDGFNLNYFISNETEETYQIVPNSQSSRGQGFTTGDESFPNLEEYIWGTNPIDADTDDDGFPDEADISGAGQKDIQYTPQEFAGTNTKIEVDVIGESSLQGENDFEVTQIVGIRTSLGVIIQDDFRTILSTSDASPRFQAPFQVTAITQGTDATAGSLEYQWEITGPTGPILLSQPGAPCKLVSFGNIVECSFEPGGVTSGSVITFEVNVYDAALGSQAKGTLDVPLGGSIIFSLNPVLVPQYPIDQSGKEPAAPEGNETLGERWIEVSAELSEGDPLEYIFMWYVDEETVEDTCSKTQLPFDGRSQPQGTTACGVGSKYMYYHATGQNEHSYKISLKIVNKVSGDQFAAENLTIYTDPTPTPFPGQEVVQPDIVITDASVVEPNELITAHADFMELSDDRTYEYVWKVDGEVVQPTGDSKTVQVTAQPKKDSYDITLEVTEKSGRDTLAEYTGTTTVTVNNVPAFDAWSDTKLASVSDVVGPFYNKVQGNTSLFFVLAGIILVAGALLSDKHFTSANEQK